MSFPCRSSLLAILLLAGLPLEGRELRVCADPDNLPYSRADGAGFENRIAALVAEELGAKLVHVWHPQQRAFVRKTVGAKLCDVWMGVPSDFERVLTTRPYYRSSYVFVHASKPLRSFGDPELRKLRIGVQLPGDDFAATPPGHALVARGAIGNVVGFPIHGIRPAAERIVEAIAGGELDAGIVWGPQAGFFASRKSLRVSLPELPPDLQSLKFQFAISVGVRRGEKALRDEIDAALARSKREIDAILDAYAVPRLP